MGYVLGNPISFVDPTGREADWQTRPLDDNRWLEAWHAEQHYAFLESYEGGGGGGGFVDASGSSNPFETYLDEVVRKLGDWGMVIIYKMYKDDILRSLMADNGTGGVGEGGIDVEEGDFDSFSMEMGGFSEMDDAARAALTILFHLTQKDKVEHGGWIYKKGQKYHFTSPIRGTDEAIVTGMLESRPSRYRAFYHSHVRSEWFSTYDEESPWQWGSDFRFAYENGSGRAYLVTASGIMLSFYVQRIVGDDWNTGVTRIGRVR